MQRLGRPLPGYFSACLIAFASASALVTAARAESSVDFTDDSAAWFESQTLGVTASAGGSSGLPQRRPRMFGSRKGTVRDGYRCA